ncbi:alpha-L-rhamnosidase-related protein [Yinghuangia aomiensis]
MTNALAGPTPIARRLPAGSVARAVDLGRGTRGRRRTRGGRAPAHPGPRLDTRPAPARMAALSRYALWVNGTEVSRGPVRANPRQQPYDDVDLAPYLRPGANVVAVLAWRYDGPKPWWMPPSPLANDLHEGAFVFEARLADGWFVSDEHWQSARLARVGRERRGPAVRARRRTRRLPGAARGLGHGRRRRRGRRFRPRRRLAPAVARRAMHHRRTWARRAAQLPRRPARCAPDRAGGARRGGAAPHGLGVLCRRPDRIRHAGPGRLRAARRIRDRPRRRVPRRRRAVAGRARRLLHRHPRRHPAHRRIAGPVRPARRARGRRRRGDRARHPRAHPHLPGDRGASFRCSDPVLEQIWEVGRRTVTLCSADAYIDCPTREQRAWVGDAVVHQMVDFTTNTDWRLARWYPRMAASPRSDGMLPMAVAGDVEYADFTVIPDWSLHWVHAVWNSYRYVGDRDEIAGLLPVAERVLRWFLPFRNADGLLEDVFGWVLIDWASVTTEGVCAALCGLWGRALREFADMAAWLGDAGRAAWALDVHRRLAGGFDLLWDAERGRYADALVGGSR